MCGRFSLTVDPSAVRTLFDLGPIPESEDQSLTHRPRYNVAPTQPILAVEGPVGQPRASWAAWTFLPPSPQRPPLINARMETVFERGGLSRAARSRRCVVVADGFFEWERRGRHKQPYWIRPSDHGLWLLAGVLNPWPSGRVGCAILTGPADPRLAELHDRQPVVVHPENLGLWLDPALDGRPPLEPVLRASIGPLDVVPVSRRVNSVANDDPSCVETVDVSDVEPAPRPPRQTSFDW